MLPGARTLAASDVAFDWLFSIANLEMIPESVLARAKAGAVNFHDGPLPRYAGLNAPVWAILAGETAHGITWHMIEGGIDEGDVLAVWSERGLGQAQGRAAAAAHGQHRPAPGLDPDAGEDRVVDRVRVPERAAEAERALGPYREAAVAGSTRR